jgi:hypothetical protein
MLIPWESFAMIMALAPESFGSSGVASACFPWVSHWQTRPLPSLFSTLSSSHRNPCNDSTDHLPKEALGRGVWVHLFLDSFPLPHSTCMVVAQQTFVRWDSMICMQYLLEIGTKSYYKFNILNPNFQNLIYTEVQYFEQWLVKWKIPCQQTLSHAGFVYRCLSKISEFWA